MIDRKYRIDRKYSADSLVSLSVSSSAGLLVALLAMGCQTSPSKTASDELGAPRGGGYFAIGGITLGQGAQEFDLASGYRGRLTEEELALREQARKFDRTLWQGLALGSVTGAAIALATGRDGEDVIGFTIAGGALGAVAGAYLANKQREFAQAEDQLDAMIADVQQSNEETRAFIEAAQVIIAEDRRRLALLEKQLARGETAQIQVQQSRERLRANGTVIEKARASATSQYEIYREARGQFQATHDGVARASTLSTELNRFESNLAQLDRIVSDLQRS